MALDRESKSFKLFWIMGLLGSRLSALSIALRALTRSPRIM